MSDQYDGPELTRQIYLRDRRITALEQERDRLWAALNAISQDEFTFVFAQDNDDDYWRVVNIARAALAAKEG